MAVTPSSMLALGTIAPDFELTDAVSGQLMSLQKLKSTKATVIMFICNHCPFVVHVREGIIKLCHDYQARGVQFIAISSNDIKTYPSDSPEKMREIAKEFHYPFPYLFDETQQVAKAYQAACTPDFYVFDNKLACVYRGQMDNSRPGNNKPVTGADIRAALDAVLAGKEVNTNQVPSQGCNIKWRV